MDFIKINAVFTAVYLACFKGLHSGILLIPEHVIKFIKVSLLISWYNNHLLSLLVIKIKRPIEGWEFFISTFWEEILLFIVEHKTRQTELVLLIRQM